MPHVKRTYRTYSRTITHVSHVGRATRDGLLKRTQDGRTDGRTDMYMCASTSQMCQDPYQDDPQLAASGIGF